MQLTSDRAPGATRPERSARAFLAGSGRRFIWQLLLSAALVLTAYTGIFVCILLTGSRVAGMLLGFWSALLVGQLGFAFRFLSAGYARRIAVAFAVFLAASLVSYVSYFVLPTLPQGMYGFWAIMIPYLAATIAAWEWIFRRGCSWSE